MSSRKRIVIVAKKEIIEFIRDWRTIVALVLIPHYFCFHCCLLRSLLLCKTKPQNLNQKPLICLIQSDDIEDSLIDIIENQTALVTVMPLDRKSHHIV